MKRFIIDRFEEDHAYLEAEDLSMHRLRRALLPKGCKEGDSLLFDGQNYRPDEKETLRRTQRALGLLERLTRKKPK